MKSVVLLFDSCCIFEIVTLNYFLNYSNKDVVFASVDGKAKTSMEGYSINADMPITGLDASDIELLVITGGSVEEIDTSLVHKLINLVNDSGGLIAGICAGVDVLEKAGILSDVRSVQNTGLDVVTSNNIITSRANAHVDFAIEVGKKLALFQDEADVKETIDFWKHHKRAE